MTSSAGNTEQMGFVQEGIETSVSRDDALIPVNTEVRSSAPHHGPCCVLLIVLPLPRTLRILPVSNLPATCLFVPFICKYTHSFFLRRIIRIDCTDTALTRNLKSRQITRTIRAEHNQTQPPMELLSSMSVTVLSRPLGVIISHMSTTHRRSKRYFLH